MNVVPFPARQPAAPEPPAKPERRLLDKAHAELAQVAALLSQSDHQGLSDYLHSLHQRAPADAALYRQTLEFHAVLHEAAARFTDVLREAGMAPAAHF